MRLYLVQHAEAMPKELDNQRPLTAQGREDVVRTGGFLSLFERPKPTRILHSQKLRAGQTAAMFAEAWGCDGVEEAPDLLPMSDAAIWAARLVEVHEDIMLVGHKPHLPRLAGLLLCDDAEREVVHFRYAGVTCLERNENEWSICWQIHPALFYPQD